MMDSRVAISTDLQLRDYVFCQKCEDLFNKNGEAWVLRNCFRHKEGFALKAALKVAPPVHAAENLTVYAAASLRSINVFKLAYFAASMFFKSSVHEWKSGRTTPARIRLGAKYENEIRSYLLGASPFPKNAVLWVNVVTDDQLAQCFMFPNGQKEEYCWRYEFLMLGLSFTLFVGARVPKDLRQFCFVHSPEHYITLNSVADSMLIRKLEHLQRISKPAGSFRKWVEEAFPNEVRNAYPTKRQS